MVHDIRFAIRRLASRPGYSLLILSTLALGIGAATAVFSVVDQTVLRPAPFAHADRLVDVLDINQNTGGGGSSFTPQKIVSWQAQPALFERFEAAGFQQVDVTGTAEPERIAGLQVSLGLLSMLGVGPRIGRGFQPGDGAPGSEPVVIIGEGLWQRRFGGAEDIVGQQMLMNDIPHTIIGVMPRRFRLLREDESIWLPIDLQARIGERPTTGFYGIGRLAPGVGQCALAGGGPAHARNRDPDGARRTAVRCDAADSNARTAARPASAPRLVSPARYRL